MPITLIKTEDGFNLDIADELWFIWEFKVFLEDRLKDKKNGKEQVLKELGYLYFYNNPESDFTSQTNDILRHDEVLIYVNLPQNWKPDALFNNITKAYMGVDSLADKLLKTARLATDKLNTQLGKIDLDERDKSGKPIYNLKQFNETIKQLPDTMEALNKAEKAYINNKAEKTNIRKGKEKSIYEDGI